MFYFGINGETYSFAQQNIAQQPGGKTIVAAITSEIYKEDIAIEYINLFHKCKFTGLVMVELRKKNEKMDDCWRKAMVGPVVGLMQDVAEGAIDLFTDSEIIEKLPVIPILSKTYSIGKTIRERHLYKKTIEFLYRCRNGLLTKEESEEKINKILNDNTEIKRDRDLILLELDTIFDERKVRLFSIMYVEMLRKNITYDDLLFYTSILNRILYKDYEYLIRIDKCITVNLDNKDSSILRLTALGLLDSQMPPTSPVVGGMIALNQNYIIYQLTSLGKKLKDLFNSDLGKIQ